MSESMHSLYRRGMISSKQMGRMEKPAILKQTKNGVPTKMAKFEQKSKDEGKKDGRGIGAMSVDEINEPDAQDQGGKYGTPSKGGRVGKPAQVETNEIGERSMQKPSFPREGRTVKANKRPVGVQGGTTKSTGNSYGAPNNRKQG